MHDPDMRVQAARLEALLRSAYESCQSAPADFSAPFLAPKETGSDPFLKVVARNVGGRNNASGQRRFQPNAGHSSRTDLARQGA
ncbi:hypothetical protein GCM10027162_55090 [Streptomyces incanus]